MRMLMLLCCIWSVLPAAESKLKPVGYLRMELHAPMPVTPDATVSVTSHLSNISPAPVKLAINKYTYQSFMIYIKELAPDTDVSQVTDVWGPRSGSYLRTSVKNLLISGAPDSRDMREADWHARDGIILLENEGYARKVTFEKGWIEHDQVPRGSNFLVCSLPISMQAQLPVVKPGAVVPGQLINFDKESSVYAPSSRLLPYTRHAKDSPASIPKNNRELSLSIEIHHTCKAEHDLTAVYLLGNSGKQTLWIKQNDMVPARINWTLSRNNRVLSEISGADLEDLAVLLPKRKPIPLHPGEFLTWRRVLLASELPMAARRRYELHAQFKSVFYRADPEKDKTIAAVPIELGASASLRPK